MTLKDLGLKAKPIVNVDLLEGLDDAQLLTLRQRLDKKLRLDLKNLDLAEELGMQYRDGMTLLASVREDKDTPANQRAQVFNSVGAMLEKIIKLQKIVYDAERLKRMEAAILKTLKELPDDKKRLFFDLYGEYLTVEQKAGAPEAA
jgi:hypothetical protein